MRIARGSSLLAVSVMLFAHQAFAQEAVPPAGPETPAAPGSGATVYPAAYFASSGPRSALDIARQVPGFALDLGNAGTRGFAGAAGNVVINGSRPSSKSETLEVTLARIPAGRVVRVEIGSGASFGADYAGKGQVLNVILSDASGIDGSLEASAQRLASGKIVPNLTASAVVKRGPSTFSLSAASQRYDGFDHGPDTLTDAVTGELIESREKENHYNDRAPFIAGSWSFEPANDRSAHINARYESQRYFFNQDNHVVSASGEEQDNALFSDYRNPAFELGGDISRPLAGGAIKLVGVATRRTRDTVDRSIFDIGSDTSSGFEQFLDARSGETIARIGWSRAKLAGFAFEAGAEAVLNSLDAHNDLFELDAEGERTAIELPIEDATVREKRAEAFVRLGRELGPGLRLDGGLAYEYSKLAVRGDATADRTLQFLKPNLSLDWKPGGDWHAQASARRTVAQLDFFDFLSRAELGNDVVNGGNSELVPQRAWEYRATLEHPFMGDGLVRLDLGHDRISLLQDRILTPDGFDSPGNIGAGRRSFAKLTVDAPLARVGLKGARLKFNGELQRTRVDDPIDGEPRNFSGAFPDWRYDVEFRQDLDRFSYGIFVENFDEVTTFRTDEFNSFFLDEWFSTAFVEYRPSPRTTVTFDVRNLFNITATRTRLLFDPNRKDPVPDAKEVRVRNGHVQLQLTVKQSFGGGGG